MNGHVDDHLRALIRVPVSAARTGDRAELVVWVDTAFNGGLVIPRATLANLGLPQRSAVEATLADGSVVEIETFACFLDWFGNTYQTQVVASDSEFALLGTLLLAGLRLEINYAAGTVRLDPTSSE